MKSSRFLGAALFLALHPATASAEILRVVLIGGQSNADGRASGSELPPALQMPQDDVPLYFHRHGAPTNADGTLGTLTTVRPGASEFPVGAFGPEITLGRDLSPAFRKDAATRLVFIKYAKGGSSLHTDWKAGGNATTTGDGTHYRLFQRVVTDGLAKLAAAFPADTIRLAGMIWVQGESDINGTNAAAAAYSANLTTFIADVRQTFQPTLPFFLSQISDRQTAYSTGTHVSRWQTVRAAQQQVSTNVPGSYLILTDGPAFAVNSDKIHYSAIGQQALGAAFAKKMAEVLVLKASGKLTPGGFRLDWNAIPGKAYQIRRTSDFQSLTTISAGVIDHWTESSAGSLGRRFFQLAEQ